MTLALQSLFSSLVNGSVYVLIGIGIVLCYRSSRVVNLAQGETYSISGLLVARLAAAGLPLALAGLVGLIGALVFALALERLALRRRLSWPPRRLLIVTLGVALLAEGVLDLAFGANTLSFSPLLNGSSLVVDGAAISQQEILIVVLAVAVTAALWWFFRFTLIGQATTACSEDPTASATLGINVARMRQLSFGLAGILGGVTALLIVPITGVSYNVGLTTTLNGFVAAAFANMLYPGRVLWAGMVLGLCEGAVGAYWNPLYEVPVVLGGCLLVGVLYLSREIRFGGAARA